MSQFIVFDIISYCHVVIIKQLTIFYSLTIFYHSEYQSFSRQGRTGSSKLAARPTSAFIWSFSTSMELNSFSTFYLQCPRIHASSSFSKAEELQWISWSFIARSIRLHELYVYIYFLARELYRSTNDANCFLATFYFIFYSRNARFLIYHCTLLNYFQILPIVKLLHIQIFFTFLTAFFKKKLIIKYGKFRNKR